MNYRILPLTILLAISSISCFSRNKAPDSTIFCCLYTHYVQTADKNNVAAVDSFCSILEVGERICKYGDLMAYVRQKNFLPEELQTQSLRSEDSSINEYMGVLQNYPEGGRLIAWEFLHPSWQTYEETLDTLHWQLLPGDSTILNYACHRARTQYAGREWTAWYTPDIPVSSGPWKLTGLPGLILWAGDGTGTHAFRANSMFNVDRQPISAESEITFRAAKRDKFIKTRNQIKTDPQWVISPWYNDREHAKIVVFSGKLRRELGLAPFVMVNGIKYPCIELSDGEEVGCTNQYRPLELY